MVVIEVNDLLCFQESPIHWTAYKGRPSLMSVLGVRPSDEDRRDSQSFRFSPLEPLYYLSQRHLIRLRM